MGTAFFEYLYSWGHCHTLVEKPQRSSPGPESLPQKQIPQHSHAWLRFLSWDKALKDQVFSRPEGTTLSCNFCIILIPQRITRKEHSPS